MTADIFFVNEIPFFISLSLNINFTVVRYLEKIKPIKIFKAFKEIYIYYLKRGFQITTLHVDGKFAPLKALIQEIPGGPKVNLASDSEHVTDIERQIQLEKESIRYIRHSLPLNKVPKIFLIHLVFQAIKMLNHFPLK